MSKNSVPFWHNDPDSWDNVYLGDEVLPGLNRIEQMKAGKRKTDIKTANGTDGASIVDQGYEPASFTIVIEATFEQELSELADLLSRLQAKKKQTLQAYSISHPLLTLHGISSAYLLDISSEKKAEQVICKISCIEFIPLKTSKTAGKVKAKTATIQETFAASNPGSIQTNPQGSFMAQRTSLPAAKVKPPKP